jgi:glycerophosphoryl diester phosphodiesterase
MDWDWTRPLIIAHRGDRGAFPENTPAAFRGAERAGAPMIELDVTLTRDRHLVVIHDETLDRTTDGHGPVGGQSLAALRRLDAGGWFHPRFAGERIPTLADVFAAVSPAIRVNVEIKPDAVETPPPADAVERQVIDCVRAHNAVHRVLISSFHWDCLTRIADAVEGVSLGVLRDGPVTPAAIDLARRIGALSVHPDQRYLTPAAIAAIHDAGFRVIPYTVNDPVRIRELLTAGIDGFFTDNPAAALAAVGR